MRGLIGGMLTGGLVSVVGLGALSVVSEQPAGIMPPGAPLVDAPVVEPVDAFEMDDAADAPNTPVGSISIDEPLAPALSEGEASAQEPDAPAPVEPDAQAPRVDTDPLDELEVTSIEGAMEAPSTPEASNLVGEPMAPVLPNPQSLAPQTPTNEADVTVSTTPAQPSIGVEPASEDAIIVIEDTAVEVAPTEAEVTPQGEDFFVVDLGADAVETDVAGLSAEDIAAAIVPTVQPRVQLGGGNSLLSDRDTGVTIRRPGADTAEAETEAAAPDTTTNALQAYSADSGDTGGKPLLSIVLIDDGSMSAAAAALAGLPFSVTIAIDPALPNAADLMTSYRADGFEVAVMAKLPEGAVPSNVEVTFESVFASLPETIAVLDIGAGGLQSDRAVTEQAMDILAAQGRGFITASQGLNMAGRAAEQAGVPSVVVFRDLDVDNQDACVVRRFVDQAAFRARQESGVVLVGRVRPDTISALILWGTANQDDQVAVVPVSAVFLAQE
jgi:polysaccharide deacetylase 2 family uncharacterized protein YibQ